LGLLLGLLQVAIGGFGLALALAKFGFFPPLHGVVARSPRGPAVYVVLAFFATFMIGSGVRELL
jgi:hypothetical protein